MCDFPSDSFPSGNFQKIWYFPSGNFPKVRLGPLRLHRRLQRGGRALRPSAPARKDWGGPSKGIHRGEELLGGGETNILPPKFFLGTLLGGRALRLGQTRKVATYENARLGSCHLGKYPWEVAFWKKSSGKVPNILTNEFLTVSFSKFLFLLSLRCCKPLIFETLTL